MNCHTFQRSVGAFADGELEVDQNLEALEHLNMCPRCARRVEDVHALRNALRAAFAEERTPDHLRNRVAAALAHERTLADEFADPPSILMIVARYRRILMPIAAAACMALLWVLWSVWRFQTPLPGTVTMVAGQAVADIREQHRLCQLRRAQLTHTVSRVQGPRAIASQLSFELGIKVIVPDFTDRGFEIAGAGRCGARGHRGAHVLYRSSLDHAALSVFSLVRLEGFGGDAMKTGNDLEYFVSTSDELTVVAWHEGKQSYAFCAESTEPQLMSMIDSVRTAWLSPPAGEGTRSFLAAVQAIETP